MIQNCIVHKNEKRTSSFFNPLFNCIIPSPVVALFINKIIMNRNSGLAILLNLNSNAKFKYIQNDNNNIFFKINTEHHEKFNNCHYDVSYLACPGN